MKNIITFISFLLLSVFLSPFNAKGVEKETIDYEEITFDCLVFGRYSGGEHVIKNNVEYKDFFFYCTNNQLPTIDFTKHTLIGYISSVAGCQSPEVTKQITKINNDYSVKINIVQQGLCERLNHIVFWSLIPKIDDNATVQFTIVKKLNK
tara:strand:- start:47 stop:496 length:450 start_codon:yes stop_codon:yes gene_type:complete